MAPEISIMSNKGTKILISFILPVLNIFLWGCGFNKDNHNDHGNHLDTLKVVTLYGPTSYFLYNDNRMGVEYENVRKFAEDEGMPLQLSVANSMADLLQKLSDHEAHLAAYPVPIIGEYSELIIHCGPKELSRQVIVQRKGNNILTDVTELVGKDIYVEKDSKFSYRLSNLNDELGGGINIINLPSDTIDVEFIMKKVETGEIDYAVVDSEEASLFLEGYPGLDLSLKISTDQAASWAVAPGLDSLAVKIDRWENRSHPSQYIKEIYKRYFDRTQAGNKNYFLEYFKNIDLATKGKVSEYDNIFKKYAELSGFDWQLLAAVAYCESRFNPSVVSPFGAYGLMQVMPSTAQMVGIEPGTLANPEQNIKAAAKILAKLSQSFEERIPDPEERIKFVIASYNSGVAHIFDAMALAEKSGFDPRTWTGNVSIAALMKSRPEYYNDPVVKYGYFRGRETVDFVDNVLGLYKYLKQNTR